MEGKEGIRSMFMTSFSLASEFVIYRPCHASPPILVGRRKETVMWWEETVYGVHWWMAPLQFLPSEHSEVATVWRILGELRLCAKYLLCFLGTEESGFPSWSSQASVERLTHSCYLLHWTWPYNLLWAELLSMMHFVWSSQCFNMTVNSSGLLHFFPWKYGALGSLKVS